MLDLGWTELFVIAVVAILVIGPRDLPRTLKSVGQFMGQMRRMAGDFRKQFDDAVKEAELDEFKKGIDGVQSLNPRTQVKKAVSEITSVGKDLKDAVEGKGGTTASPSVSTGAKDAAATATSDPTPLTPAPTTATPQPTSASSASKTTGKKRASTKARETTAKASSAAAKAKSSTSATATPARTKSAATKGTTKRPATAKSTSAASNGARKSAAPKTPTTSTTRARPKKSADEKATT